MKKIGLLSLLLIALVFGNINNSIAQFTLHPLSFPTYVLGTATVTSNFYANYVGTRLEVLSPAAIAGDKQHSEATGTTWPIITTVTTPIVNKQAIVAATDTLACSALLNGTASYPSMSGKIAIVFRGNCYFSDKALAAQNAGAIAVIIVDNRVESPIGMSGAGTSAASVTIPVFMITQADGDALVAQYRLGDTPRITITPWGLGNANDLGFVPGGPSLWHNTAIPQVQLASASTNPAYTGLDGAFVANYGTNNATHVQVKSDLTFTSGTTVTHIHSDSNTLNSFPAIDSIWAIYSAPYNLPAVPDTGHFTLTYTISSDSVDQYIGDNTFSYNYYVTNNLYCKSKYDFTKGHPLASLYEQSGSDFYIWGSMYYIAQPGQYVSSLQYSMDAGSSGGSALYHYSQNSYLFQWTDGDTDALGLVYPKDSIIQNGELQLIGVANKVFDTGVNAGDTSGGWWTVQINDSNNNVLNHQLTPGWYFIAPETPGSTTGFFLGCDGVLNNYPRTIGRFQTGGGSYLENTCPNWGGGRTTGANPMWTNTGVPMAPLPFMQTTYVNSLDSVVYNGQVGLIPSVSLIVSLFPEAVKNPTNQAFSEFKLFPNPATEYITASVSQDNVSNEVTYTIIDNQARVVSKVSHYNVKDDNYTYNTTALPTGNYYMVVNANGKAMFKKFAVIRK